MLVDQIQLRVYADDRFIGTFTAEMHSPAARYRPWKRHTAGRYRQRRR